MDSENHLHAWLDHPLTAVFPKFSIEKFLIVLILLIALVSRFAMLGERVMSHDETNHVVPSYDLFMGRGYRHDPVTHGPMQFHLLALSYFLFGDSDFSSRIPAALFSVATIAVVMLCFRRYLGRAGALIAGFLFLISPYMLFYGRYTRNEAFVALFGVLMIYAVFRYLEKGDNTSLFILTVATALQFTTKETVYIYVAQLLLFLAAIFLVNVAGSHSRNPSARRWFIILTVVALVLLLIALGVAAYVSSTSPKGTPVGENQPAPVVSTSMQPWEKILIYGGAAGFFIFGLLAVINLIRAFGWEGIRHQRAFDMLILIGTLVLPQLAAFPVKLLGWDPLDYSTIGLVRTGGVLFVLAAAALVIGMWWRPAIWLICAAVFYTIFTVLYTTFFTNGRGFWTGIVGGLGYWLAQQGVQRGSQPWYYYGLIQVPMYEYLGALGTILAAYFATRYRRWTNRPGVAPAAVYEEENAVPAEESHLPLAETTSSSPADEGVLPPLEMFSASPDEVEVLDQSVNPYLPERDRFIEGAGDQATALPAAHPSFERLPVLTMLVYWAVTSLVAYSIAGEKMPWLTVHIALPLLLAAGWGLGFLVDTTPWRRITGLRGIAAVLLVPVFLTSLGAALGALFGPTPPFRGNELAQLESTNTFILGMIAFVLSGVGIVWLLNEWRGRDILRLTAVTFFALLAVLTARAAYTASFINYDTAKEYLVYAHAARGPKDILAQVEEISRRTTGGKDLVIAYDNDALYPYWWYLRDYPNKRWFTDKPTRDLRDVPVIIASENNYAKMDPIVRDNFVSFDYMRLWWPNQDYYNLTWERFLYALTNREMRAAIFNIWLNRDYTDYARITNNDSLKLETWQPSSRFRLYLRKDIVAQIWNYGAAPSLPQTQSTDPYQGKMTQIIPDAIVGSIGNAPGQLNKPRGLRVAPDGTIYVADSANNRIEHFNAEGTLLQAWGSFGETKPEAAAPSGTFNEPWDVAVGPDGSVYVTDTWNHRVQKFTADGQFITMWGKFGQAETGDAFWGPRGLAIDAQGRVYVTDTGNKRVAIFNPDGQFITQFGSAGMDPGQFDEPVGIAIDGQGNVYVADTWNQRIQIFQPDPAGTAFTPILNWEINGWNGQSLDNKPFLAVDASGHVFATDPEGYRVLEFNSDGSFLRGWGDYSTETDGFGLAAGVAVDAEGRVWVSDAGNMRLLRFTMPKQ